MITGKKRVLIALLLALTMVFSVMFGTVSALATGGPRTYTINVKYRFGGTTIANGPSITLNENQLSWQWDGPWWDRYQKASYQVTEDYAGATAAPGKDKADYGIAAGATETVWFIRGQHESETAEFQLSRVHAYSITVRYVNSASQQVGNSFIFESGNYNGRPFDVEVDGRNNVPSGYVLAEAGIKQVRIDCNNQNPVVEFLVTPVANSYSYIINVEYRYNGNLVRTGNTVTAIVGGLIPLNVTVTPDASIIPAPYYLLSTASKTVAVSPSNNVHTVVFELTDSPVVIPDDDVPLDEPKTGTPSNTPMIIMGFMLTIMAIGLSSVSFFKQKKSAK